MVSFTTTQIDVESLTIQKNQFTIILEHLFGYKERGYGMSTQELELLKLIHENDNPELAVLTAIKVFAAFLAEPQTPPEQLLVALLESA